MAETIHLLYVAFLAVGAGIGVLVLAVLALVGWGLWFNLRLGGKR